MKHTYPQVSIKRAARLNNRDLRVVGKSEHIKKCILVRKNLEILYDMD